jgi:hypothetical protein
VVADLDLDGKNGRLGLSFAVFSLIYLSERRGGQNGCNHPMEWNYYSYYYIIYKSLLPTAITHII